MVGTRVALIGRDGDVDEIAALLDEYSLVTLVGPGGVGKTILAMELTATVADRYEGGVFVAELAGASEDEDVAGLVARQVDADSIGALRLRTAGRRTLVVLDNCESAVEASRQIAADLVAGDSEIKVVATSRSPLYALGERVLPVRPLEVAAHDENGAAPSAAVELFLARSDEAGARWSRDEANLAAVSRLVHQLNGLPLAIELAAARSRVLGPNELVEFLDQQLDLLVRPGKNAGESEGRHHSLRSVIEASYEPLTGLQQEFLRSVAFMAAPFDLRLAHGLAGVVDTELDSLDLLSQLVDCSLVDVRQSPSGKTEYLLLDSIRAFCLEKLSEAGEAAAVGERYADAVTSLANDIVAAALESFSAEVMGAIRDSFTHLVNAVTWCVEHDPSPARSYQMFLPFYGPTGARSEIADLAQRVRAAWDEPAPLQAEAFAVMGSSTFRTGRYQDGAALAAEASEHPDATALAKLMGRRTLGYCAAVNGDTVAAKDHLDAAIEAGGEFSASFGRELRISRAAMVREPAESPQALASLADVLAEANDSGEWVMVVWAGVTSAYHHLLLNDAASARRAVEQALAVAEESGVGWAGSVANRYMASLAALEDGWAEAAPHFLRALDVTLSVGDVDVMATTLRSAAAAARRGGRHDVAARLWATIPSRPGLPVPPSIFHDIEQELLRELGPPPPVQSGAVVQTARLLLGADGAVAATASGRPTDVAGGPTVRFGDYELDPEMCELRCAGERVAMEPQVYDVLVYLIERRGSMVTKNELLDEVWGDRFVSESALSSRIAAARRATGDNGKEQKVIRTVHGKGFSFVADVAT